MVYICMEFYGDGDPFFGGEADDRPLGINGRFLTTAETYKIMIAEFPDKHAAVKAGGIAMNRRAGSRISALKPAPKAPTRALATIGDLAMALRRLTVAVRAHEQQDQGWDAETIEALAEADDVLARVPALEVPSNG